MLSRFAIGACFTTRTPIASGRILQRLCRNPNRLLFHCVVRQKVTGHGHSTDQHKISLWNKIFGKYLLTTNTISSGVLMVIGDVLAQEIEMRRDKTTNSRDTLDYNRIWRMFAVGALMGPLHHYVYIWMDRVWPIVNVGNSVRKILVDQFVVSPVFILLFFYSACCLERKSISETNDELVYKFPYIYLMDWIFWPGAQYVNFQYVDIKYRVIFVNVATAIYNVFLSYMKHDFNLKWL